MPIRRLASVAVACLAVGIASVSLFARGGKPVAEIASDEALSAAINHATGPLTLRLAPGRYRRVVIGNISPAAELALQSADGEHPAILAGITVNKARLVTLRDLIVSRAANEPVQNYLVSIVASQDVLIQRLRISAPGGAERGREYGIMIRGSDRVRVSDCQISGTRYGIGILHSRSISLKGNELHGLQTDGIRGGGVDNLVISENVIGDFEPKPTDHPDGIQLWSTNEKLPAKHITISSNLIVRNRGGIIQGIFIRDTQRQIPFEDVDIRDNLVIGSMYNGIALAGVTRGTIANNEVIAYPDMKSWIRLSDAQSVDLTDNQAGQFLLPPGMAVRQHGNREVRPLAKGDLSPVRAWLSANPELAREPGPYLRRLIGP